MPEPYTPTLEEAREVWTRHRLREGNYPPIPEPYRAEFDRMIAAVEAKACAKVIDRLESIYGKAYMADEIREHFGIEAG